mgnify:CR=1 FL=1
MKGLLAFLGMSIGGWSGWVVGARLSTFMAFTLSMVGTGAGIYYAKRIVDRYF